MSGLMQQQPAKIYASLRPASNNDADDAEQFARARFINVLQAWASDRLVAQSKSGSEVAIRKAA